MKYRLLCSVSTVVLVGSTLFPTYAQETIVEEVIITASAIRSLEQFTPTGSRLGITARETPFTLDIISAEQILGRGFHSVEEAASTLPGVLAANPPADLGNFSMRGFTGNQITLLHNGLNIGPATMIARPGNSFNLASIEVLKGPASVLYGQGAIGGAFNVINKAASFDRQELMLLASAGSYGTTEFSAGGTTQLADTLAVRADFSQTATNGFVRTADAASFNGTVTFLWRPMGNLDVQLTIDYLNDHPSDYLGTPLVSSASTSKVLDVLESDSGLVIDERTRFISYNVADSQISSEQYWPQLLITLEVNENLTFRNFGHYYWATREWRNSEVYQFNDITNLIDRDRFFVFHDHVSWGNQSDITYRGEIFQLPNSLVVGFDYSNLDFKTKRGGGGGDSVDRFNPSPGLFGSVAERVALSKWDAYAFFVEDGLDLTPNIKIVTGARFDTINLDRKNFSSDGSFNASSSFNRTFTASTWRIGMVYDLTENITPYASYSTGKDPAGSSSFFLVNAGQNFDLSSARQYEVGVKASLPDNRADVTIALFDIQRKNILTLINKLGDATNVGSQESQGFEISGDLRVVQNWSVSANVAYTKASYGTFFDPDFGIDASGNRPANVAKWITNVWTSVRNIGNLPLELGGGLRFVGERFGNSANDLKLKSYSVVDVYASYEVNENLLLTARAKNVFDKAYVQWADVFYPSQVILGAPQTFEISAIARF